jgi:hypothetical protein
MSTDQDVLSGINGVQVDGSPRPWAWVRVRARTVFGNLMRNKPFTRVIDGHTVAASTSELDHDVGTSEQVSWRYVASNGMVFDLKDFVLLQIEHFIATIDPPTLQAYIDNASQLRPYPANFSGDVPGT